PTPFMRKSRKAARANDVWHSNQPPREIAERAALPAAKAKSLARRAVRMPEFVEPQLCSVCEHAPSGTQWAHEVKFDGYRIQLRAENGSPTLRHPNGPRERHKLMSRRR